MLRDTSNESSCFVTRLILLESIHETIFGYRRCGVWSTAHSAIPGFNY